MTFYLPASLLLKGTMFGFLKLLFIYLFWCSSSSGMLKTDVLFLEGKFSGKLTLNYLYTAVYTTFSINNNIKEITTNRKFLGLFTFKLACWIILKILPSYELHWVASIWIFFFPNMNLTWNSVIVYIFKEVYFTNTRNFLKWLNGSFYYFKIIRVKLKQIISKID